MNKFDLLVIGGGSGGVRAARRAASLGLKVGLFEKERMGGTCVLKGCIPKKLMIYGSSLPDQIKIAKEYGWNTSDVHLDWSFQKQRRDQELSRLSAIYTKLLTDSGVHVIEGEASLSKEGHVVSNNQSYSADKILIAVGGYPYKPDIPGAELGLDSDDIFQIQKQPKSVVIIGSGYIALEFAGIFNSLGILTTVACRKKTILNRFDHDVRDFFTKQMLLKGVQLESDFEPSEIKKAEEGFSVHSKKGSSLQADLIIFATGRLPNTSSLNLEQAGVQTESNKRIIVDADFQTSKKGIYAVGDCANTSLELTPIALAEAEVFVKKAYSKTSHICNFEMVPTAVFCNPPIATIGMSEQEALEKGYNIDCYESQFRPLKYTINPEKTGEGIYIKLIVDKKTQHILGCHMVGEDTPEIIQGVAIAINAGATKQDFDSTIGLHPSTAEELCTLREPRKK